MGSGGFLIAVLLILIWLLIAGLLGLKVLWAMFSPQVRAEFSKRPVFHLYWALVSLAPLPLVWSAVAKWLSR